MSGTQKIDPDLVQECDELLGQLSVGLPAYGTLSTVTVEDLYRAAHTVKGLLGFIELPEGQAIAQYLAGELKRARDHEIELTSELATEMAAKAGSLNEMIREAASGPAEPEPAPSRAGVSKVASFGTLRASASAGQADELARATVEVLESYAVPGATCSESKVADVGETTREFAVLLESRKDIEGSVMFTFDAESARGIASAITASMLGEEIPIPADEEREFVQGALGELINRAVNVALEKLHGSPQLGAPTFAWGKGTLVAAPPASGRVFDVSTSRGSFEVAYTPGTTLEIIAIPDMPSNETKRIAVIADDSIVMRKTMERVLGDADVTVVAQAPNGQVAVEEFRRHRPDLVVLDINMPVMSGLDALKIIRAEDPSARVLICSAVTESGTIKQGLSAGAVGYVTKPFEPKKLVETVKNLMSQAPAPTAAPRTETRLNASSLGPYRVVEFLGEGGMAVVYKGEDVGLGRPVALKVLRDELSSKADVVVRFLNEARAVAKVSHPNVIGVYYAGSDAGKHFFAMELLPGPDLEELVQKEGPLPEREALNFIVQAAAGLAAASQQGLVHCDVTPANLLTVGGGLIKVTDFGISRAASEGDENTSADIIGTPCFMSPEQVMGRPVDFRTDMYGLGTTLHYLMTGAPPYDGTDGVEVALRQVHDPVPQIPTASRKLNRLIARMMAKAPEARHASYDELLQEVRRML